MKTISENKNMLLKRNEVLVVVPSASNPGMATASKMLAEHFKVTEDLIAIKSLESNFGKNEFNISALIYSSLESKNSIEPRIKVKKAVAQ